MRGKHGKILLNWPPYYGIFDNKKIGLPAMVFLKKNAKNGLPTMVFLKWAGGVLRHNTPPLPTLGVFFFIKIVPQFLFFGGVGGSVVSHFT